MDTHNHKGNTMQVQTPEPEQTPEQLTRRMLAHYNGVLDDIKNDESFRPQWRMDLCWMSLDAMTRHIDEGDFFADSLAYVQLRDEYAATYKALEAINSLRSGDYVADSTDSQWYEGANGRMLRKV